MRGDLRYQVKYRDIYFRGRGELQVAHIRKPRRCEFCIAGNNAVFVICILWEEPFLKSLHQALVIL